MADVHKAERADSRALHIEQAGRSSLPPPTASRRPTTIAVSLAPHPQVDSPAPSSHRAPRRNRVQRTHVLNRLRAHLSRESGFSLIEVSLVSVTLTGLAAIAVFSVSGSSTGAHDAACTADVRNVRVAEEAYFEQTGEYAPSTTVLMTAELLKTEPPAGEVVITMLDGTARASVTGSSTSACDGFSSG
jgi:Tfp pilus assembly protein PilE